MPAAPTAAPGATQHAVGGPGQRNGQLVPAVQAEVAAELAALQARCAEHDRLAGALQDQAYAAWDAGDTAKGDKLHDQLLRHLHLATSCSEKVKLLRTPEELERRVQLAVAKARNRARLDSYLATKDKGDD